jgi:hypothetical protein
LPHPAPVATEILMTARRRPPREPVSKEPVAKEPPREPDPPEPNERDRYAVALEQLNGQIKVVIERARDTLTRRESEELAARTEARVDMLADVLRLTRAEVAARFDGVDKRLDGLDKSVDQLGQEVRGVRQDMARQAQVSELRALEQRVTVVERHLGL